jgi:NAD(P)-dependent dehydrogenase (short-subunit alcohol dehydrogenase family)
MTRSSQSIVVTGASTGIGRASVLALLDAGFRVFAGVRDEAAAARLREAAAGGSGEFSKLSPDMLMLDVTNAGQIAAAAEHVGQAVGEDGLWGLFNNAGITVNCPFEHLGLDELRRQLEVNVVGQVAVTQAFIPLLRRARGRIVNTGSVAGFMALPALGPYAVSKHAMEAFSDSLRRELRPWGIEVSLLEPGPIRTDIWQKGVSDGDALQQTLSPQALADYGPLLAALRRVAARAQRDAAPPEVVTRAVVHAFTASRPKTRYLMGTGAGIRRWIARLPDRWQDALVAKALRL